MLTGHRIENYSILLASCAPVARLFLRAVVDHRRGGRPAGYWSRSRSRSNEIELKRRAQDYWLDSATMTNPHDEENVPVPWDANQRSESRVSKAPQPEHIDDECVTVKTDIVVLVDDGQSTSSGGAQLLPEGGESSRREHR